MDEENLRSFIQIIREVDGDRIQKRRAKEKPNVKNSGKSAVERQLKAVRKPRGKR